MAKEPSFLEWHGQQWRVVVRVPRRLQPILGVTRLKRGLGTADVRAANELKHAVVGQLKAVIRQAKKSLTSSDPVEAEALRLRLQSDQHDDDARERIETRAIEIAAREGGRRATDYAEIAQGFATPLDHHADTYGAFKAYRQKTEGDFRRALGWLKQWLEENHRSPLIEYVTRKDAGMFLGEFLMAGRGRDKASAYLALLREYWRWLVERGHAEEDPWAGQRLPRPPRPPKDAERDTGKRPYTDTEIATLVYGDVPGLMRPPPSLYLADLMRIAALSGMRLEEICQLRVGDCQDGTLTVHEGKTANATRDIPIHTQLAETIARLSAKRPATAFLIGGLPPSPKSRETRSDPASKAFTRYRRKVQVDERPNDKAKSNVDFHSFRRWFIRKARDAYEAGATGFSPWTIADIVGHDDEGVKELLKLTMGRYPGPSAEEAKRAVVEAVKLPTKPPAKRRPKA